MTACSPSHQRYIGLALATFMLATRFPSFGDALHLVDASWAIFFIAGFYLSPLWLGGLMLEAVVIDMVAVGWANVPAYCLTPAYGFLLAAYAVLWQGGRWLVTRQSLGHLLLAAGVAAPFAFVLSNASFYWLGGQVAEPGWAGFVSQFGAYLPMYALTAWAYIAVAAIAHRLLTHKRFAAHPAA